MPDSTQRKPAADDRHSRITHRPIGLVQPDDGPGLRAARALEEGRIADALQHATGMTEGALDIRAWRALLGGLITIEQGELCRAEPSLHEAAALALAEGIGDQDPPGTDMLRLGARALLHLGWIYRRTERCGDAIRVHLAAHRLHMDHGSHEEIWESATELGLDEDVARNFDNGQRWHRTAIDAAEHASQEPLKKQALALTNLVTSHEAAEQFEEAVEAARTARDCWYRHDPSAIAAARADAKLGKALLKLGERLTHGESRLAVAGEPETGIHGGLPSDEVGSASVVLAEAVGFLAAARDALLAFGPAYRPEADSFHDQEELATRLDDTAGKSSKSD